MRRSAACIAEERRHRVGPALEAFELQEKEDAEDLTRLQEATDKAAESGVDS